MIAGRSGGKLTLRSRRGTDMTKGLEDVAIGLITIPDETVIDGEVVALDEQGKPNFNLLQFNLLQNVRSAESYIMFYAFDVLVHRGEDIMKRPDKMTECV
jgi:ATP-dependent DNA ligase